MAKVQENISVKNGKVLSYSTVAFIGELDSGKPFQKKVTIRVTDLPPGTPTTPAKQKKAAEDELNKIIAQMREDFQRTHSTEDRNHITLSEFISRHWWTEKVQNGKKSPNTVSFYADQVKHILDYFGPDKKLSAIDVQAIIKFSNYQRTQAKKENGEPISQTSAAHRFSTLRAIIGYAYRTRYIRENPFLFVENDDKITQAKQKVTHLTEAEIKAFESMLEDYAAESGSRYWQVYFLIALRCGLRRGEILPLQWRDVTIDKTGEPILHVEKNAVRNPELPDKVEIRKPKRDQVRDVPIPPQLYRLMMEYRAEWSAMPLDDAYMFPRKNDLSKIMYTTVPTQKLRKLEQRYFKQTTASVHDLRHSVGSELSRIGTPLKVIQQLLGHSDSRTTANFYIGTDMDQIRKAVNKAESAG